MKSDKELLKELVEYFDEVMVDVEEGKPFEKVKVPDDSGHELEFKIDMVLELFQNMMRSYLYTKDCLMRIIMDLESLPVMGNSPQVKNFLEKLEKYISTNKQINEYFDLHEVQKKTSSD